MKKIIIFLVFILVGIGGYFYKTLHVYLHTPLVMSEKEEVILVPSGYTLKSVTKELQDRKSTRLNSSH